MWAAWALADDSGLAVDALGGERPGLKRESLCRQHAADRCQQRVAVQQFQVTGQLLDRVDGGMAFQFHSYAGARTVAESVAATGPRSVTPAAATSTSPTR